MSEPTAHYSVVDKVAWYTLLTCVAALPLTTSITNGAIGGTHALTADPFHVPKLALLTILTLVASAAWLVDLVANARPLRFARTLAPLAVLALLITVSTAFALEPASSLFGVSNLMTGAITWLLCIWFSVLVAQYVTGSARVSEIAWAVVAGGTVVAVIAVVQAMGWDPLSVPHGPDQAWMIAQGLSTLGNPDYTGMMLVLPTVLAAALFLAKSSPRMRSLAATCALILATGLFVTLTRAAWLGALVGTAVLFAVAMRRDKTARRRAARATVAGLAAVILGVVLAGPTMVVRRFSSLAEGLDGFSSGRITLWGDAIRTIARYPLFGTGADRLGLGAYHVQTDIVVENGRRFVLQDPHNLLLLMAGVFGIAALLSFFGYVTVVILGAWRRIAGSSGASSALVLYLGWFAGLVGVLVASVLSVYTIAAIFVLFVSLAVVAAPLLAPIRARAWMMAVAVILVTALVGVSAFGAARSFAASRQVALAQTGDTKLRLEEAIRLTPWDARTRFNYLWRKAGATQPVLTGPDAAMARAASDALDTEIKLAILDFPHELLLYRMRMDLYAGSQGYPGYQPDKHLEAIDAALAVFPNDVEFTDRRQALEGAAN